ncbi:MAG: hypothetical protein JOZ92_07425, partial [Candidatus Dormibacteraeota bacterium]|nr:hypothetical protein [Candidatus Dormibacteraeota bacterium]
MSDPATNRPARPRRSALQAGRLTSQALVLLATAAVAAASLVTTASSVATQAASGYKAGQTILPNPQNDLDCNGWSNTYKPISPGFRMRCTDPINPQPGEYGNKRFEDNGHYVGHDEPTVRFSSASANSGN